MCVKIIGSRYKANAQGFQFQFQLLDFGVTVTHTIFRCVGREMFVQSDGSSDEAESISDPVFT